MTADQERTVPVGLVSTEQTEVAHTAATPSIIDHIVTTELCGSSAIPHQY